MMRTDGHEVDNNQVKGHTLTVGDRRFVQQAESSNPMEYGGSGVQTSSPENDDGFLSVLDPTVLAIVCACAAAALFICLGVFLWMKNRRRRQKLLRELTFNGCEESKITKSAPSSRCGSPRLTKRMSCPDAYNNRSKTGAVLVKSWTCDPILDSTMPPECVQPKNSSEVNTRRSSSGSSCHSVGNFGRQHSTEDEEQNWPPNHIGRIWYSTFYDTRTEQLNVNLVKVRNLPRRDQSNEDRDPFVKIYLLPDERTCQVSKSKKSTLCPVYNELYQFQVPPYEVKERTLRFSVYDMDKRRVRHSLGHTTINLSNVDLNKGDVMCSDLEPTVQSSFSLGDLQLSLAYIPAKEKVKVGVHKSRKLQLDKDFVEKGAYVRIQLFYGHKCHRIKRTVTRPMLENCPFEESLSFTIQGRQLESCSLVVTIMITHPHEFSKNDIEYGRVVIGPFMYARGEELVHWQEMVSKPKVITTHWHTLVSPTH